MVRRLLGLLLPLAGSALAVYLSTLFIPGIETTAKTGWGTVGTVVLIAVLFGLVNLLVKPIAKFIGCALYALTLGLIAILVNGLLLYLTSWIAGLLDIPFKVYRLWPAAIVGALFIGLVSWGLNKVSDIITKPRPGRISAPPPPQYPQQYGRQGR